MSFSSLAIGSDTFNPAGPGRYSLSTVTFGDPQNQVVLSGGALNKKTGLTTASFTRQVEKDIQDATDQLAEAVRRKLTVQLVVQTPYGFTPAEIAAVISGLGSLAQGAVLDQVLQGAS